MLTRPVFRKFARLYGRMALLLGGVLLFGHCREADRSAVASDTVQQRVEAARARLSATPGGQRVLRAIEAHGGLAAWYAAPTSAYAWEYSNTPANLRFKSYLVADNDTRRVYHRLVMLGTPDQPAPAEGRFAWDGAEAWISPAAIDRINPRFWATTGYYFESIPFILADPGLHYSVLPEEALDGIPHDMVRVSYDAGVGDSPDDTYTLYLNKDTGLVDALRYTVTYGRPRRGEAADARPVRETLFYYEDYVTVDGLTVPTHFRGFDFVDGKKGSFKNEAWASEISFREPFDAQQLRRPDDARVQPPPTPR